MLRRIEMNRILLRFALGTAFLLCACVLSHADEKSGEVSLFNGKDLSGWDGAPGWWYVEDGVLTSESSATKPCKVCNYLIWKGDELSDFELTAEFKLSGMANCFRISREVDGINTALFATVPKSLFT
jgi:hypothetical protein